MAHRPLPELPGSSRANRPLPPLPARESPAPRISAVSTVPPGIPAALAKKFQVWITPLRLDGVELGHLFSPRTTFGQCILLCARVGHPHDTFDKPDDVALAFATPWGEIPDTGPLEFAQLLRDHDGYIPDGQFCGFGRGCEVPDYPLFGIPLHLGQAAAFVGAMGSGAGDNVFDLVVLNRHAEGMTLADVVRAIRHERQGAPIALVCHFDRDPRPAPRRFPREVQPGPLSAR